jgi:hypothetical protein
MTSGMVIVMGAVTGWTRSVDPQIARLLWRSLTVAGLLFGFLVLSGVFAHAEGRPTPHSPTPELVIGHPGVSDVPTSSLITVPITAPIAPITASIETTAAPVTRMATSVATKPIGIVMDTAGPRGVNVDIHYNRPHRNGD